MARASLHRLVAAARSAVAHGLYYSGVLGLWCRVSLRRRAVVLTYHRVLPDDAVARTWSHPGIVVTRHTFDTHVRTLKRFFRVLSLDEFLDGLERADGFAGPSCLITFDDGWRDTYTEAWPVLPPARRAGGGLPPRRLHRRRSHVLAGRIERAAAPGMAAPDDAPLRAACERTCAAHQLPSIFDAAADDVRLLIRTRVNALKSRPLSDAAPADCRPAGGARHGRRRPAGRRLHDLGRGPRRCTPVGRRVRRPRHDAPAPHDAAGGRRRRRGAAIARDDRTGARRRRRRRSAIRTATGTPGVADAVQQAGYHVSFSTERGSWSALAITGSR